MPPLAGSRTIRTLLALLASLTIGTFVLIWLETAPARPTVPLPLKARQQPGADTELTCLRQTDDGATRAARGRRPHSSRRLSGSFAGCRWPARSLAITSTFTRSCLTRRARAGRSRCRRSASGSFGRPGESFAPAERAPASQPPACNSRYVHKLCLGNRPRNSLLRAFG